MSSTEDMGGLAPEKDPLVADEPEKAIMVEKSEIGRKEVFVALSNGSMEEWLRFERKGNLYMSRPGPRATVNKNTNCFRIRNHPSAVMRYVSKNRTTYLFSERSIPLSICHPYR